MRKFIPFIIAMLWVAPGQAADQGAFYQTLLTKQAPSLVSVRAVLKTSFKGAGADENSESRLETSGVIVDNQGLVMISNAPFSTKGMEGLMGMGGDAAGGSGLEMTPQNFKIVFPGDEKEYDAFLAATDTQLGLTFVRIKDLAGRVVSPVSFDNVSAPVIGDEVVTVSRMGRGYDFAPYFETARISGMIARPRQAWMLDHSIGGPAQPVFNTTGQILGVLAIIHPAVTESSGGDMMMFLRMLGGGGLFRSFLAPTAAIQKSIAEAQKRATDLSAHSGSQPKTP